MAGGRNGFHWDSIPLKKLRISASNVRQRDITADIDELTRSLELYGLQQPIVVQESAEDDLYEIVIGQRRYLAAKQLGWKEIDARVLTKPLDPYHAKIVSFSENVQRRDLAPRDKADVCKMMLDELGSVADVADELGISQPTVRKWLGYAAVPDELKKMVEAREITVPQAMTISQHVPSPRKAVSIARRMVDMRVPKSHRDRIVAAAEEMPDAPVDMIFTRAEEKKVEKRILIVLPAKWSRAMDRASRQLRLPPTDIARDAVIEWLETRRF